MAIIIKLVSLIYISTFALKPFEMMELTNEYLKLIPIKKRSDYKIKHLFMTLALTIRFVVLYTFFFCRIVNGCYQRFSLAQTTHDQVTTPQVMKKKTEEALPTTTPKTDKSILIDQITTTLPPTPSQETVEIINDDNHTLHDDDDNKSEHDSINPTPTSSSNNTTSSSASSSITEHSSIDLSTNEQPALEIPSMDKKINEPIAVQTQLEPYTILSTVNNEVNSSLEKENKVVKASDDKEEEKGMEKEQETSITPKAAVVDSTQDTQEEIESVAQKFPMVPSTETKETTSSPVVVQHNPTSEGSATPALTSSSSSRVSPASHRSSSTNSFKARSSSLLSALKGGEPQQQQQIIPQLPEKQPSRFSSMRISGGGHKKKVPEMEESLQPKVTMSSQLKKGLKRFGTKVKHSGKRASKIFD